MEKEMCFKLYYLNAISVVLNAEYKHRGSLNPSERCQFFWVLNRLSISGISFLQHESKVFLGNTYTSCYSRNLGGFGK